MGRDRERGGVQGMPRKEEPLFEGWRPAGANELQVAVFVAEGVGPLELKSGGAGAAI